MSDRHASFVTPARLGRRVGWRVLIAGLALAAAFVCVGDRTLGGSGLDRSPVRGLLDAGAYADAEERAAAQYADALARYGPDSLESGRALDLVIETAVKRGKTGSDTILPLAALAVDIKERHLGGADLEVATSLHNLGAVHTSRGEFALAVPLHERGLSIRRAALARDDVAMAESLDHLATALIQVNRFDAARRAVTEAQAIREHAGSEIGLARTLERAALLHRQAGTYADALPPLERALAIRRKLTPQHPDTIALLQTLGDVRFLMGDPVAAQRTWTEALELGERTVGSDHPAMAELLRRLGLAAFGRGELAAAAQFRARALRLGEASLSACDQSRLYLLSDMATSRQAEGQFGDARSLYRRGMETLEACARTGEGSLTSDSYATLFHNDAVLAIEMGDLQEARRLYQRAVEIWSEGLGAEHQFVARGLDGLASIALALGRPAEARTLYERALAIRERTLGRDHPLVASSLTSLAGTADQQHDARRARAYADRAIAISRASGATDDPDQLARALMMRGTIEASANQLASARASFAEALADRTRIFGASHPLAAESRAALALLAFTTGDRQAALVQALDAERDGWAHLRFTVRYLPERQALAYADKRPRGLNLAISVAASAPAADVGPLFDAVIQSRGVVLDELAARGQAVARPADPQLASLDERAQAARQRYANLIVRSLAEPVAGDLLEDARREKEESERLLAERSVDARGELARATSGLADVRRSLPAETALVSFLRYERTVASHRAGTPWPQPTLPSYVAFVVRPDATRVAFVDLGRAAIVDDLVRAWRGATRAGLTPSGAPAIAAERAYRGAATRLREAVWDPVSSHVAGAARVFIVPDGLLNVVNFAALPTPDGTYLVERPTVVHYLTTERDLLAPVRDTSARALLAVGGPAFDDRLASTVASNQTRSPGCAALGRVHFEPLPGSLAEATEIGQLWPATQGQSTVLSGAAASETAVKRALPGRRVVHLATHGFFLGGDCADGASGTRGVGGLALPASAGGENPLMLAGLAFAGVNRRDAAAAEQDEGILTAEEIAGLDLQGTEWAVLSACDTGLGEIKAGEGVFGLRRAFQIAGARTVIMSLWSVDDQSTRAWMRALYESRLRDRRDTADAVRAASLAVLHDRRAKGLGTHPFYWAAFVAAGDWR